ncbi:acyltransferase family protein [Liquorilactobacillus nagelii]|jgi:hypothetical protein|uniref:acyltransferase family protein n=1 Tax=Liquorilactobacillus nagelii TaxID=82688 RepID=UPI001CD01BF1|nr:acyltransferase [Liquorilactobacillus nagelii]ULQ48511.1 acyltransferase [Liquorilactobacillus nagelii]
MTGKKRFSNFELLRIISMFLIVVHHYAIHGTFIQTGTPGERIALNALIAGGKIGVNVFVIIGGFFLVDKKFSFKRPISISLIVGFYSYIIYFILKTLKFNLIKHQWYEVFLPVPGSYWFAGSYIVLLFLIPYLNVLIKNISRVNLKRLILFLTVVWIIVPTFIMPNLVDLGLSHSELGYSTVSWFCYLYLLAAYIKKYPFKLVESLKASFVFLIAGIFLLLLSIVLPCLLSQPDQTLFQYSSYFLSENSLLSVWISIGLFLVFKNISLGYNYVINLIAGSTFAVYLIHDNLFVRNLLWGYVNDAQFHGGKQLLFSDLITSAVVFSLCIIIDLIRRLLLGGFFKQITQKLGNFFDNTVVITIKK